MNNNNNIIRQNITSADDLLYDIYDRQEDEALARRRELDDMSEDDTEEEG